MLTRIREWFRLDNPLPGDMYALMGLLGFLIKFACDKTLARLGFQRSWELLDYIRGANAFYLWDLQKQDAFFFASMLTLCIPFMAFGVWMTLRRLRTLQMSFGWVIFFFIPVINLFFFMILSMPDRYSAPKRTSLGETLSFEPPQGIGRYIPQSATGSAIMAVVLTALMGAILVGFNAVLFKRYGWGLFVLLPFTHGLTAAWIYGYHRPRSLINAQAVAGFSCLLLGVLMLTLAIEGAICIAMAAPIWLAFTVVGAGVGWEMQQARWKHLQKSLIVLVGILSVPMLMGAEYAIKPTAPLLCAKTAIEIQAPPSVVWDHVIAFSELPSPTEWIFRTGLAFPIRARINGHGVGAIRRCEFSTGAFIEPIEIWNKPSLLRFSVTNTPSPMEEMSLYSHIEPPHLHGYMISKQGQFLLTALPGGRTRLEGTTWYEHNLWPARYWQLWSDYIIHQIHLRVLRHIKSLAENSGQKMV